MAVPICGEEVSARCQLTGIRHQVSVAADALGTSGVAVPFGCRTCAQGCAIIEQIEHKPMRRCRHTQMRLTRDLSQVCNAAEHDCLRSVQTETNVDDDVNVECSQSIFNHEKAASYQLRYDAALCFYVRLCASTYRPTLIHRQEWSRPSITTA
jgi:hypothetical protein